MPTYVDPGFGRFLRTDPGLLAAYREGTGMPLADMPRLVTIWRAADGGQDRDGLTPAEAEEWLLHQPGADDQDVVELALRGALEDHSRP